MADLLGAGRSTGRRARLLLIALVVVLVAAAVVVGLLIGRGGGGGTSDEAASSDRTQQSDRETEGAKNSGGPADQRVGGPIPEPRSTEGRADTGFPHTTMGAVSAAAHQFAEYRPTDPQDKQDRYVDAVTSEADRAKMKTLVHQEGAAYRKSVGLSPDQAVPSTYYVRAVPKDYIAHPKTANQVEVWLLTLQIQARGDDDPKLSYGSEGMIMTWEDGDWKRTLEKPSSDMPKPVDPDDKKASEMGWRKLTPEFHE